MPFNLENFESCEIPADEVFLITEETLDNIYASSSETNQFYPFFHLQNEYFILKNLEYAQEAVRRDPCAKYIHWLDVVKQGN